MSFDITLRNPGTGFDISFGGSTDAGYVKTWTGTAWVKKPVKVWNGSIWVIKPMKYWNGTIWAET